MVIRTRSTACAELWQEETCSNFDSSCGDKWYIFWGLAKYCITEFFSFLTFITSAIADLITGKRVPISAKSDQFNSGCAIQTVHDYFLKTRRWKKQERNRSPATRIQVRTTSHCAYNVCTSKQMWYTVGPKTVRLTFFLAVARLTFACCKFELSWFTCNYATAVIASSTHEFICEINANLIFQCVNFCISLRSFVYMLLVPVPYWPHILNSKAKT